MLGSGGAMGSMGNSNVQDTSMLHKILFPGAAERYQFKKQAEFNRDIQQQQMNSASNALATQMQAGAAGFQEGGFTKSKLDPLEEKAFRNEYAKYSSKTGNSPNPDDAEHHYDYRRLFKETGSIMNHLSNDNHLPSTYKTAGHPNKFINGKDTSKEYKSGGRTDITKGLMTGSVTKKSTDTPIAAQSSNGPVTVHGGSSDKPSGEMVVDAKRTKVIENMAKSGDHASIGKFVVDTMNYYKARDGKGSDDAANGTNVLGAFDIVEPIKNMAKMAPKVASVPVNTDKTIKSVAKTIPAVTTPETGTQPTGVKKDNSLYKAINENYDQGRMANAGKQGMNVVSGLINAGKTFNPNAVPKHGMSSFIPSSTDLESAKQSAQDSINKSYTQAKRTLEEQNRPDLNVGLLANKLDAEKQMKSDIVQKKMQMGKDAAAGLTDRLNKNTDIQYQNDALMAQMAGQFNQQKNQAMANTVTQAGNIMDSAVNSKTMKDDQLIRAHAIEQSADYENLLARYRSGAATREDVAKWQPKTIPDNLLKNDSLFGNIFKMNKKAVPLAEPSKKIPLPVAGNKKQVANNNSQEEESQYQYL